jgi:hypothetical protein
MSSPKNTADKAAGGDATGSEKISVGMPLDSRFASKTTDAGNGKAAIDLLDAFMAQAGDTVGLPDLPDMMDAPVPAMPQGSDMVDQDADDVFNSLFDDATDDSGQTKADDISVSEDEAPINDDVTLVTDADIADQDQEEVMAQPDNITETTADDDFDPFGDVDSTSDSNTSDADADETDPFPSTSGIDLFPTSTEADANNDDLMSDLMSDPVDVMPAQVDDQTSVDDVLSSDDGWDAAMAFEPTDVPNENAHPLDLVLPADAIANLDPDVVEAIEAGEPIQTNDQDWGDDHIIVHEGDNGLAVVETTIDETVVEGHTMDDTQEGVLEPVAKKGFMARFKKSRVTTPDGGELLIIEETMTEETLDDTIAVDAGGAGGDDGLPPVTDIAEGDVSEGARKTRVLMILAMVIGAIVVCLGAYAFVASKSAPVVVAQPTMTAPNPDPDALPLQPVTDDTIIVVDSMTDPAADVTIEVDTGDLAEFMDDGTDVAVTIETGTDDMVDGPAFDIGNDDPGMGNLDDLFIRDDEPEVVVELEVEEPLIDPELFVAVADFEGLVATAQALAVQVEELTTAIEQRDAVAVERDALLQEAIETARRAENLSLAQNELVIEVIQLEDKMDTAEALVVDLSQRLSEVEMNDPADRTVVDRQLVDLNRRIEGLSRDVGLVARMSINGGGRIPASADTRNRATAQAATPIYDQSTATVPAPNADPSSISNDVKVGDNVQGYGRVLDIVETSGGGRLVVMENGSAIIE